MRKTALGMLVLAAASAAAPAVRADARVDERTQVHFEGLVGKMAGLFGGKAAREGAIQTVTVHGERKASLGEQHGQIIDLGEERVYDLDMKKKTYTVRTFAEIRKQMEDALRQAKQEAGKQEPASEKPPEVEVDLEVKETGQKKPVAGHDCREVQVTVTVRQKGKRLEEAGGMVLTASQWLGPRIAAVQEIADFDRRYLQKLAGPELMAAAQELGAGVATYPQMAAAMKKFRAIDWDGTPLSTVTKYELVPGPAPQGEAKPAPESSPKTVGGLLGKLGQKMAKKEPPPGGRKTVMTGTHEVLKIASSVDAAAVALPTGFKPE